MTSKILNPHGESAPLVLWNYFRSSASYRVRIGLELKKIPYEYKPIHLVKGGGEQYSEEYKKINPMAEVPSLQHGSVVISQSMVILEYLDHVDAKQLLFPMEALDRFKVKQICEMVNSGIQPLQNLKLLNKLEKDFGANQDAKNEWCAHWIRQGLKSLDTYLEGTSRSFCLGDGITAADCFVIPQIFNAHRFSVDMSQFQNLKRIETNCLKLPAFQRAHPHRQPDTPDEMRE